MVLEHLKSWCQNEGVELFATLNLPRSLEVDWKAYHDAIAQGFHAGMEFLAKREPERQDPNFILNGAKSVVIMAFPYGKIQGCGVEPSSRDELSSLIAGFAMVENYHTTVKKKLEQFGNSLPAEVQWRAIVDSAPFLEKAHARAAGLGATGNNTLLLTQKLGSAFVLGEVLLACEVEEYSSAQYDKMPTCGTCTRCIDACPTSALVAPRVLDANRCRAYLSVEHRGPVADEFVKSFATTLFGCDLCQTVCPYNRRVFTMAPQFTQVDWPNLTVFELATLSRRDFDRQFSHTSFTRARHDGMVRNALYHLYATQNPRLEDALNHWENTEAKNIRAVVLQLRRMLANLVPVNRK